MASLRIAEIFSSVQGEGVWTGIPSTFVRVSGCNLRCAWCDTPYASWRPEGPVMELEPIRAEVARLGNRHVVLTGGEPMLFEPVVELTRGLAALGHAITVETAGTVDRPVRCHLMSISPKLANSTPAGAGGWAERHDRTRLNLDALRSLIERYEVQLKFVAGLDLEKELVEIESLLARLPPVRPERVLLMPEGTDEATLRERQRLLVEPCIARGWRLCSRLHVQLFGNRRGT